MKSRIQLATIVGLLALAISAPVLAQQFPAVLSGAVTKLRRAHHAGALLPTTIPAIVLKHGIKRVVVAHTQSGYSVAMYYSAQTSDATFAGMVAGSTAVSSFSSLPGTSSVLLADGTHANFRPVSCGGSCAPANLWWTVDGHEYQLQLKLRSTLSKSRQLHALVQMANSMKPVR